MGLLRKLHITLRLIPWVFFWASVFANAAGFRSISDQVKSVYLNPFREFKLTKKQAADDWGWIRDDLNPDPRAKEFKVPYETGRGVLTPVQYDPGYEVLLKGTGANPEHIGEKNAIRYGTAENPLEFDGKFKVREAYFDIYNSHYLSRIGVKVAIPIGVASLGDDLALDAERGIYAREMLVQTRISNLHQLDVAGARSEIEAAIQKLSRLNLLKEGATLVDYYFYMVRTMAKTSAIMQSAGFQHGYLHHQQFTLAGELTDVGTGTWLHDPDFNSFSSKPGQTYFKFERQPALVQNILLRTHSVSGDQLHSLAQQSETRKKQSGSLLGVIDRIDPAAGQEIRNLDPERMFWKEFEHHYQHFDRARFILNVKPSSDFKWVMHRKTPTQTPKTALGEPVHLQGEDQKYWRKIDTFFPPNFETNSVIDEKRLSVLGGPNSKAIQQFFPPGYQSHVASNYWGLLIEPDKYTNEFFSKAKDQITSVAKKYGSLLSSEATEELLYFISGHARLPYGPYLNDAAQKSKYSAFVKDRYSKGRTLGDLLKGGAGECHDTALLTYLFIQQVREVEPAFDARIIKSAVGGDEKKPHFFTIVRTPADEVVIIDPQMWKNESVMPYSDALQKGLTSRNSMHAHTQRIYEFNSERNVCDLYLKAPKKMTWLKRVLGF